jgi:polypeptide N-acetylgalactosaminyltransferase
MTSQNEVSGWMATTVHSIIARTPPHLLKEVIVVDDNGMLLEIRGTEVDEKEYEDLKNLPKVKVIQNHGREGCARSRLIGAKAATGEVIMFVDSHTEQIASTWYQHLVLPILEDPRTLAIQTIDTIDDTGTREYKKVGHGSHYYGFVNDNFYFTWQSGRFDNWVGQKETPGGREPYATPVGPGSLFAMRRDEFWRLGGYDEGLYVWGGENTELALKTWMCGGRVVMVPCSRVGHMFRKSPELMKKQWPPKIPKDLSEKLHCNFNKTTNKADWINRSDFGKITQRNNIRVMEIWVGDHPAKYAYYKKQFGHEYLEPQWQQYVDELKHDPAALKQIRLKSENKCHDFEWYDKHVMMKLAGRHHPWYKDPKAAAEETVSCGQHRAKSCDLCPKGHGKHWCNGDCVWCGLNDNCISQGEYGKTCTAHTVREKNRAPNPSQTTGDSRNPEPDGPRTTK